MARPRSSIANKALTGTLRPDRLHSPSGSALPLQALPAPPKGLSAHALHAWEQSGTLAVQLGTLTPFDIPLLELTARTLGSVSELELLLRAEGMTVDGGSGGKKAHPGLAALDRARALSARLLSEFGLTPPSRERLSFEAPKVGNPFNSI
ncbi:MAG: hypothetical protein RLZZ200_650 [Pseudomonadota bacterium]|jgi:P27 family predicted phage terminase small subunit